jgi:4-amino-4-deoxy-L-arabinose transferase-like glycosyltransferase
MKPLNYQSISSDNAKKKRSVGDYLFWLFIIIYTVSLLYTTNKINIAEDEIYTLNTTSDGFLRIIHQSYYFEYQPPFYFLVLSWWRLFSSNLFFIKLFSVTCILVASLFFYKIVTILSSGKIARWMVIIFLLNPFTVWASLEIRLYAFLMMLSAVATYYFCRYHFENKRKLLLIFAIVSLFGIYTQYFFSFLIIAFGAIELITKKRKDFFRFVCFMAPVILLSLPNLLFISAGIGGQQNHLSSYTSGIIHKVIYTPRNLVTWSDEVAGLWLNRIIRLLIYIPLLAGIIIHFIKPTIEHQRALKNYFLVVFSILIMIALYGIAFSVSNVGYEVKYQTVAFPLFMLIFIIICVYTPLLRNFVFGYIAVYFAILLTIKYANPVKTYDYKSVATYLESNQKQDEPIFIYRAVLALPLKYYYDSKNEVVPLPHAVNFNDNYRFSIEDTFQLQNSLLPKLSTADSFYFVSDTTRFEGFLDMKRDMVSEYLDSHYKKTLDTFLMGYGKAKCLRIRHYEK